MNEQEKIELLRKTLEACQYELTTLSPRLTPTFRKSVEAVREMARDALDKTR